MKKKFRLLFFVPFLTLTIIGATLYFICSSQPKELSDSERDQLLSEITGNQSSKNIYKTPQNYSNIWKRHYGKYYSFLYSGVSREGNPYKVNEATASGEIESFAFEYDENNIFTTVTLFKYEPLEKIPSVVSRKVFKDEYNEVEIQTASISGLVFNNVQKSEKVGFFQVKDKILVIGMVGDYWPVMERIFNKVLGSFSLY